MDILSLTTVTGNLDKDCSRSSLLKKWSGCVTIGSSAVSRPIDFAIGSFLYFLEDQLLPTLEDARKNKVWLLCCDIRC